MNDRQEAPLPARLRELRRSQRWTQHKLAGAIGVSKSLVQAFESGKLTPQEGSAARLDEVFGTGTEIQEAATSARDDKHSWMRPWRDYEKRAIILRTYQPLLIPGLLQCESYMQAVFSSSANASAERVAELMDARRERQAATLGRENPVALSAIIGEAALRQAPREIMKEQLEHLIDIGHRPNVRIRVLRDALGLHAGLGGAFVLATLDDGRHVGYLDDLLAGHVIKTHGDLADVELVWEAVDALALPVDQSRDLILRMIDELK